MSQKPRIIVTGAKGQLGSELNYLAANLNKYKCTFIDIEELNLANTEEVEGFFRSNEFDFLINCAAYTAVDKAETDSETTFLVNAEAVRSLARVCKSRNIRMIHISTDYVFDGQGNQPIGEEAATNPLSVYGKSKLQGEKYVTELLDDAYIIRTAWVYSTFGKNFIKTISALAHEKESLNVVYDQVGSPTYARDLAAAILAIIDSIATGTSDKPGIYHYSNEGAISWYDLAYFITQYYKLRCHIRPIRSEEYKTAAERPKFSVLDKVKIKQTFGIQIPHWHQSLIKCLDALPIPEPPIPVAKK